MSVRFTYPGSGILDAVHTRVEGLETLRYADAIAVVEQLNSACRSGLSLEQTRDATTLFFQAVDQVLEDVQTIARLDTQWLERVVQELERGWYACIPLLPADVQYSLYNLVDRIYRYWAIKRDDAAAFQRVEEVFKQLPIPAVQVADLLLANTIQNNAVTPMHLQCFDVVEKYADNIQFLLFIARLKCSIEFQYAQTCAKFSGSDLEHLRELWGFNKHLTGLFGTGMLVHKVGFFGGGQKKDEALAQWIALNKQLTELTYFTPSDPWVTSFTNYIRARIDAAYNEVKSARKGFKKLLEADFAVWDTSLYLAFVHNFLNDRDDARRVLEEMAFQLPYVQGDTSTRIDEIYTKVGGNPATFGHAQCPDIIKAQAKQNELRRRNLSLSKLASIGKTAISAFYSKCEAEFHQYIAKNFQAEHFNAALNHDSEGRTIQIDSSAAAAFCIDELPALSVIDRMVLVESTQRPIPVKRLATEVLKYLDHLSSCGRSFEELTKAFPGFGHSWAVAWRLLRPLVEAGEVDEIARILDHVEGLRGMPDAAAARLFQNTAAALFAHSEWMGAVERGRRLVGRFRDPSAQMAVVQILRDQGFRRLNDESVSGSWLAISQVLLDLAQDEQTQQRLVAWLESRVNGEKGTIPEVVLEVGGLLANRLTGKLAVEARRLTRNAILRQLAIAGYSDARVKIVKLRQLCPDDLTLSGTLATWFLGRCSSGQLPDDAIDLGEWLHGQVADGNARGQVRAATRDLLLSRLREQAPQSEVRGWLDRLMKVADQDSQAHLSIVSWYQRWQPADSLPEAARAEMGEWLMTQVPSAHAEGIRTVARKALEAVLLEAKERSDRIRQLERLTELCPSEPQFARRLGAVRKEQMIVRLKVVGIAMVAVALALLVTILIVVK